MEDHKLIPDKEAFDTIKKLIVITTKDFLNYTEDQYFSNRIEFFHHNPEKNQLYFLKNELVVLDEEMKRQEIPKKLLLWNIERFYSEDELDKEFDYWDILNSTMLKNIDFIKTKMATENGIKEAIKPEDLFSMQNNLTPGIPIKDVFNHFKVLIEPTEKEGKYYLTPEQFHLFIKSTFIDMEPIKQNFNFKGKKKDIRKIFRAFFDKNEKNEKGNKKFTKQKYFDIMDKGFFGFNTTDYKEFHR